MAVRLGGHVFQFHKVRLKEDAARKDYLNNVEFQFHKVRLKEVFLITRIDTSFLFQFHKVRLKDNTR